MIVRFLQNLTIRSRLMVLLLLVSLLSCVVMGVLGTMYGQKIIGNSVSDRVILANVANANQIDDYFSNIFDQTELLSLDPTIVGAAKDFKRTYQALKTEKLNAECTKNLHDYYYNFVTQLSTNIDVKNDIDFYIPHTSEGCYLQFKYIVENKYPTGEKKLLTGIDDGTDYDGVHQKYHNFFKSIEEKLGFYDIFLVDNSTGDIVYTVEKEVDYATNLFSGPHQHSNLAELVKKLVVNNDIEKASIVDFQAYRPSLGAPAAFVGIPLTEAGQTVGILVGQVSLKRMDEVLQSGYVKKDGNGYSKTGESFIVADDYLMRSTARSFREDSTEFVKANIKLGVKEKEIKNMYKFGSTTLHQKAKNEIIQEAFNGNPKIGVSNGYLGQKVVGTAKLLNIPGLRWVVVTQIDEEEGYRPVTNFMKNMFIQTVGLMLLVTLLALFMSNWFMRPIELLNDGVTKINEGDYSYRIANLTKDEFGKLGSAFNDVMGNIQELENKHTAAEKTLQKTLSNFLPYSYIKAIKEGSEGTRSEAIEDCTLIMIDISGFSALTTKVGHQQSISYLNEIFEAIDEVAEKYNIEKIRSIGDSYFAGCGLFEPRLDHANRCIQFAKHLKPIINQFNINNGLQLELKMSIHSGEIYAGIIGSEKYTFDIWGETVNHLFYMNNLDIEGSIILSEQSIS